MQIDLKSFVLGVIVGGCAVVYNASVAVARDRMKKETEKGEA